MTWRAAVLGAVVVAWGMVWLAGPAEAGRCQGPVRFVIAETQLPMTRAAVKAHRLSILALGGAATAGGAARDPAATYPARLLTRLREGLPKVDVLMTVRAAPRRRSSDILPELDKGLARVKPALVIWGPGGSAAAHGEDAETFGTTIDAAIARTQAARADLLLMTLQYAPSVLRLMNLAPYRMAVIRSAEAADIPVFDRYDFMRFWNANGILNLDATDASERVEVARTLFDCIAQVLAEGIIDAVR